MGNVTIKINVGLGRDPQESFVKPVVDGLKAVRSAARRELGGMNDDARAKVKQRLADEREALNLSLRELRMNRKKKLDAEAAADREAKQAKRKAKREEETEEKRSHDAQIRMLEQQNARRIAIWREENRKRIQFDRETIRAREQIEEEAIRNRERAERQEARNREAIRRGQTRGLESMVRGGGRMAWSLAGKAWNLGVRGARETAQAFGADTDLSSAIGKAVSLDAQSIALANQAYQPGSKSLTARMYQDPEVLQREARSLAVETGYSASDVMTGLTKFVEKTGDLQTARNIMAEMAKLSRATNTEFYDMVDAAANVALELGDIPDKEEKINQVMRGVAAQGKQGAVEIRDLSRQMAKIAAAAGQYGGDRAGNILTLSAFAQMARSLGGAASSTQAAQSVMSFTAQFRKRARVEAMKGMKLNPFDSDGNIRDPFEFLLETIRVNKGNTLKMGAAFADQQAQRVTNPFAQIYREAYSATTGDEKAKDAAASAAVRDAFDKLRKATVKETEMATAFAKAMGANKTKTEQFNAQMELVGKRLMDSLQRPLEKLAPIALTLADHFGDMVDIILNAMHLDSHEGERRIVKSGEKAREDMTTIFDTLQKDIGPMSNTFPLSGFYNPEHVGAAKNKLKEVSETIEKLEEAISKANAVGPPTRHGKIDPKTGDFIPDKEWVNWTGHNPGEHLPTVHGYESREDWMRAIDMRENEKKLAGLKGDYAELSTLVNWLESMKKGGALRVWVDNKEGAENKPQDVAVDNKGSTESGGDLMSHEP